MLAPDDGRRVKPSYLVLGTFLGCLGLIYGAWLLVGQMAAAVVFLLAFPAIILAGLVATVARSAWLHRMTVFTHMKATATPKPMRSVEDDTFYLSQDGTIHQMQKRWLAEELNKDDARH